MMEETKPQKELLDLIISEGVEWPERFSYATQDRNMDVHFYNTRPKRDQNYWIDPCEWGGSFDYKLAFTVDSLISNWRTTVVTRKQWENRVGGSRAISGSARKLE